MADLTGTNNNNVFFFQGSFQQLSITFIDPYTGEVFTIDDEYYLNMKSYDGLGGTDSLFMTNFGDALFLRDPTSGNQMVFNVEIFFAGDGGDVIHLADAQYTLGNITVDGGGSPDIILSNAGDDILKGQRGDDYISGGPGNDILYGGNGTLTNTGNDTLNGGSGADLLLGEDGDDILIYFKDGTVTADYLAWNIGSPGVEGTDTYVLLGGTNLSLDVFNGGDGFDTLVMTDGNDTLFLDDPYHAFHPSASSLRLVSIEQINAGDGDDVIDLTHDTLTYGDIIIYGEGGNDHLWSSAGNDHLYGGTGDDHLYGGFGSDELNGDEGNDTLYGSLGNDILRGGAGDDVLYGGASSDSQYVIVTTREHIFNNSVVFPSLQECVNIADLVPSGGNALGVVAGDLSVDFTTTATVSFVSTEAGFKNTLGFYNVASDGTIQSVDLAFPNVKNYTAGDTATIDLPGAPDTDFGFFMIANGANRNGNFGNYDLENGEFKFIYHRGKGDERLAKITDDAKNIDLVYYKDSIEAVVVGSKNHIYHTTLRGGATNLNPDNAVHTVSGIVDGSDGHTLRIGFEDLPNLGDADYNDVVFDITIQGKKEYTLLEPDADILLGGEGDDVLNGGIGSDILAGGLGFDTLYGEQGSDMFLFQSLADSGDTIMDFEKGAGGDILNITDLLEGFDLDSSNIASFMRLVNSGSDTALQVNTDGQGSDFASVAVFTGGLGNTTISDLLASGNLVVDQSISVV